MNVNPFAGIRCLAVADQTGPARWLGLSLGSKDSLTVLACTSIEPRVRVGSSAARHALSLVLRVVYGDCANILLHLEKEFR